MENEISDKRKYQKKNEQNDESDVLSASTDEISRVEYPIQSDTRRAARVAFRRKVYHLGPFESPISYVVFGMWKQRLIKTGIAVPTKELRPLAKAALKGELPKPPRKINSAWFLAVVVVGFLLLAFANYQGYRYFSTYKHPVVDGVPMSARELSAFRRTREAVAAIETAANKVHGVDAKQFLEIRRELEKAAKAAMEGNPNAKPEAILNKVIQKPDRPPEP